MGSLKTFQAKPGQTLFYSPTELQQQLKPMPIPSPGKSVGKEQEK